MRNQSFWKNQDVFLDILNALGIEKLIDIRPWWEARFVPWTRFHGWR